MVAVVGECYCGVCDVVGVVVYDSAEVSCCCGAGGSGSCGSAASSGTASGACGGMRGGVGAKRYGVVWCVIRDSIGAYDYVIIAVSDGYVDYAGACEVCDAAYD